MKNSIIALCAIIIALFSITTHAEDTTAYDDEHRWAGAFYVGQGLNAKLLSIFKNDYSKYPETIYTGEISYTLKPENRFRRFFQPFVSNVEVAANVTIRNDRAGNQTFPEFNAFIGWRWNNFPWNHRVTTSLAVGEGISYGTKIPSVERRFQADKLKRLVNYLMLEATFALPKHKEKEILLRMHHRSKAFGLYGADNHSTNAISIGFRYRFN